MSSVRGTMRYWRAVLWLLDCRLILSEVVDIASLSGFLGLAGTAFASSVIRFCVQQSFSFDTQDMSSHIL